MQLRFTALPFSAMRLGLFATIVLVCTAAAQPPSFAGEHSYITSFRVNDEGSSIEWTFTVCTPRQYTLEFETRYRNLRTGELRHEEGWKAERQGRNCARHTLGLRQRGHFIAGDRYRTRVSVFLGGRRVIRSRDRTFRVY